MNNSMIYEWAVGPFFICGIGMRQTAVQDLLEPVITAMGYELLGIEFISQGRHSLLRIYLDKPEGIVIEDCEKVSRQVSAVLDVEDPISGQYTLEVSSPGLDRPLFTLAQCERFVGEQVNLRLHTPLEGRKKFKGQLSAVTDGKLVVEVDGKSYEIPFDLMEKANLVSDIKF